MTQAGQSARSTSNFDTIAGEMYDESIPVHIMRHLTQRRVNVIRHLAEKGKILDVGCGTGRLLSALPSTHYQRHGLDVSIGMLRTAHTHDPLLSCSLGSATTLPFCDESFDVVFCAAVLHHIAEQSAVARAIHEMIRVTRSGGYAVIWDHNPLNPYWPIIMRRVPQDIGEERLIPKGEIHTVLAMLQNTYRLEVQWRRMTFIPDFAPRWGLSVLAFAEQVLEQLPLVREIAAHNVAIVHRLPAT